MNFREKDTRRNDDDAKGPWNAVHNTRLNDPNRMVEWHAICLDRVLDRMNHYYDVWFEKYLCLRTIRTLVQIQYRWRYVTIDESSSIVPTTQFSTCHHV